MNTATKVLRVTGWTLLASGAVLLLYVVYLLFYTNLTTRSAQADLRDQWEAVVAAPEARPSPDVSPTPGEPSEPDETDEPDVEVGDAYAVIWFERPGEGRLVRDDPLYVIRGVTLSALRSGPGHYPESAAPGGEGNFAVAGHRTTHGAPFFHLDQLEPGDEIHVLDRDGRHWRYIVRDTRIVAPRDVWVVGRDPLGDGFPLMTLTTCHPRFSAAQRLVVFAGLDGEVSG